jgi:hypothetical protein
MAKIPTGLETTASKLNVDTAAGAARTIMLQPAKLIGSVTVKPSTIQPGQSVLVEVLDLAGKPLAGSSTVVTINGVPAARRYLQFMGTRKYTLQIRAVSGSNADTATATVTVAGVPLTFRRTVTAPVLSVVPILRVAQSFSNHYLATFTVGVAAHTPASPQARQAAPNAAVTAVGSSAASSVNSQSAPQATSYKWSFGDGTTETTQSPSVTHDYFPAIQAGIVSHPFDVTCTVVHDNVTVTRTLVLHSAYELCKSYGTIVPNVESDVFATWQKTAGFTASMTVYNIESEAITLTQMGFVPLSDNPDALLPAPVFTTMKTPITIKAKSASALGVVISLAQLAPATKLGSAVPGFIVHYRGSHVLQGKTTPVMFSRAIRIPLSNSGGAWLTEGSSAQKLSLIAWDLVKTTAFNVASNSALKLASDASSVSTDDTTQTVAISLDSMPRAVAAKSQARAAVTSALVAGLAGKGA